MPLPSHKILRTITEGWSKDQKYLIETDTGTKYLLRLSDPEDFEADKELYELLEKLPPLANTSQLVQTGLCNEGQNSFRLFTWITGTPLLDHIHQIPPAKQYELGLEAGQILAKIHQHSINSLPNYRDWPSYFNKKIDRNIRNYHNCGEQFKNAHQVINYLNTNRHLLLDRPQCFHHGDYHIGNMLLTPDNKIGVIDFNRLDYGDPWEEWNRMPWNTMESTLFSNGMLQGYFEGEPPQLFFELMALYIASNQLGGFAWAKGYGESELKVMREQTKLVMGWYKDFRRVIPDWYRSSI